MVDMGRSQLLYKKAKKVIPGGTQLLSKKPEMLLPELWPAYYSKAKGCQVWDLDNKKYIDMSYMGIGSSILGYADKDVDDAVKRAIAKGTMSTLNCPEEVELAKLLCRIHPWAKMARFARTGGEAMSIAVRIARAKTRKDKILFCGYHGWHDWYLSANLANKKALDGHLLPGLHPRGVPRKLAGTAMPFQYNNTVGFLKLVKRYKGTIAAVVMEPIRNYYPQRGFLRTIREWTKREGIALIFDEITSGWRLCYGGSHLKFKVYPDICVFAKAISNGYPMAAIIGKKGIMQAAQDAFISSTYWTERTGPVAALATINKMKHVDTSKHLARIGEKVQRAWAELAEKHSLDITVSGIYPLGHFEFNHKSSQALKTLFAQEMLKRGFLAQTAFYVSYAHKDRQISKYAEAVDSVFAFLSKAVRSGKPEKYLKVPVCHTGFKRLT